MAVEPPPSPWALPDPNEADEYGLVGIGADLEPGTILSAYRAGMFPMPIERHLGWWSPDPRGVLIPEQLHISRSLGRSLRRFAWSIDADFEGVIDGCADPSRDGAWIDSKIRAAYVRLHELGWAHSCEVWSDTGELVGGVYGLAVGRLFAGESMFHRATDASKVALVHLVQTVHSGGATIFDVQWQTDHLATLGVGEIPRSEYLRLVEEAVADRSFDQFATIPDLSPRQQPSP
jgi:leucyl/phenylalanyl-tRNA--protein transferase